MIYCVVPVGLVADVVTAVLRKCSVTAKNYDAFSVQVAGESEDFLMKTEFFHVSVDSTVRLYISNSSSLMAFLL